MIWHTACLVLDRVTGRDGCLIGNVRRLPAILAAVAAAFLAARPAKAQNARVATTVTPFVVEIAGGSAPHEWRLQYGTFNGLHKQIVQSGDRVFFSHGDTLRIIDASSGDVVGRWRMPCAIADVSPQTDGSVALRIECGRWPGAPNPGTIGFDPSRPLLPNWPTNVIDIRTPQVEATRLTGEVENLCSPRPPRRPMTPDARALVAQTAGHDRLSPWLRLAQAKAYRIAGDPRANDELNAIAGQPNADFSELLSASACIATLDNADLAARVFHRAYADYLSRGFEPRLFSSVFVRLMLYSLPSAPNAYSGTAPNAGMEQFYRLSPYFEWSEVVWQINAETLRSSGHADDARVWQARADDARAHSLDLRLGVQRWIDRVLLVAAASLLASLALVVALFVKYLPQRRLAVAARARGTWIPRGFALFNLEYWSRRERAALFVAAAVLWCAVGFVNTYNDRLFALTRMPAPIGYGSLGGPIGQAYLRSLPASPERDLLLGISAQQSGDLHQAESLYRSLPQFAESWNNLGVILAATDRSAERTDAFRRALAIDPALAEASLNSGKPPSTYWTEMHRTFVPDKPMMAPPTRTQMARAILRATSPMEILPHALRGPFAPASTPLAATLVPRRIYPILIFNVVELSQAAAELLSSVVVIATWLLALVVVFCPAREVTQPSSRVFRAASWIVPGLSPAWSWLAGPALIAACYLLLEAALIGAFGSPGASTGDAPFWVRTFGVTTERAAAIAFGNPSWLVLGGSIAALYVVNALLIGRAVRARESARIV